MESNYIKDIRLVEGMQRPNPWTTLAWTRILPPTVYMHVVVTGHPQTVRTNDCVTVWGSEPRIRCDVMETASGQSINQ